MSVLYLTHRNMKVKKNGGRLLVVQDEQTIASFALADIERVVILGLSQLSTALIMELLKQGTAIAFLHYNGEYAGNLAPALGRPVRLMEQVHLYDDEARKVAFVREILQEKIYCQRELLSTYASRLKNEELRNSANKIKVLEKTLVNKNTVNELRGVEGAVAREYFSMFPILLEKSCFTWYGRRKHPAPDPVNAMLSFGYTLLAHDVAIAVHAYGLEAGIGYLHEPDTYRDSLVCDFMERFRASIVDKLVLRCINWDVFTLSDFTFEKTGCRFSDEARRKWLQLYEEMLCKENKKSGMTNREMIKAAVSSFAYQLDRSNTCTEMEAAEFDDEDDNFAITSEEWEILQQESDKILASQLHMENNEHATNLYGESTTKPVIKVNTESEAAALSKKEAVDVGDDAETDVEEVGKLHLQDLTKEQLYNFLLPATLENLADAEQEATTLRSANKQAAGGKKDSRGSAKGKAKATGSAGKNKKSDSKKVESDTDEGQQEGLDPSLLADDLLQLKDILVRLYKDTGMSENKKLVMAGILYKTLKTLLD